MTLMSRDRGVVKRRAHCQHLHSRISIVSKQLEDYCKMRLVHGLVLVLAVLVLAAIQGVESECQDWSPERDSKNVCCKKCKPGNRLITDCGPDQNALCSPCGNDTYILDTSQKNCLRCTQCIGVMRVKIKCSSSSDTVCECSQGFRCGNEQCSFCVIECVKGQQPKDRECEPCPPGTFNDQIHQPCKKWSKCTKPGHEIIRLGTAESDIKCGSKTEPNQTTSPPDNRHKDSPPENMESKVTAILVTFGVFCIVIPTLTILYLERKKIKIIDKPRGTKDALTAEKKTPEECSFCFPQQEHGGSSQTSMSSLVSEEKILPLCG
ncbi:tumor necrosis factor receptor superfamily member 9b isoform X1 [Misgurnus anguillicaudatus]|uniref:tumor necrosis factor receptor superfamily member 9b isoform X1 n=1 Tax=Misgurnus anguillicaudatus TaxID=75329 RepID=UPI003CCFB880